MRSSELLKLSCTKCGAPLSEFRAESEFVACTFCGYTQKLVQAQEYLDKLRGEVYNWLQSIVPAGIVVSSSADPLARHNIFSLNVKPRILGEYAQVKSKLSTILAHPLFVLPFYAGPPPRVTIDEPRKCFENVAKVQGIEPLAVADEDKTFFNDVVATYQMHAYVTNAFDLLSKRTDPSFLAKNFQVIASFLEGIPQREVDHRRMHALAKAYEAAESLFRSDIGSARLLLQEAVSSLQEVVAKAGKSVSTAIMIPPTMADISMARAAENVVESCARFQESGQPPGELLPRFEKYFRTLETARTRTGPKIYEEMTAHIRNIIEAKTGTGYIEALPGSGMVMVPFWDVSLKYTFSTGALMFKKGKEDENRLLVAATAPLARYSVTDIFTLSAGMMDRFKGKESTLTTGYVTSVLDQVRRTSVPFSTRVLPPFCPREEGAQIAHEYLNTVTQRLSGKVRFGAEQSNRLVYAPADIRNDDVYVPCLGECQISLQPHLPRLLDVSF